MQVRENLPEMIELLNDLQSEKYERGELLEKLKTYKTTYQRLDQESQTKIYIEVDAPKVKYK